MRPTDREPVRLPEAVEFQWLALLVLSGGPLFRPRATQNAWHRVVPLVTRVLKNRVLGALEKQSHCPRSVHVLGSFIVTTCSSVSASRRVYRSVTRRLSVAP